MHRGYIVGRLAFLVAALVVWAMGGSFSGIAAVAAVVAFVLVVVALLRPHVDPPHPRQTSAAGSTTTHALAPQEWNSRRVAAALKSEEYHAFQITGRAVVDSGRPEAVDLLGEVLRCRAAKRREDAARWLGEIGDPRAIASLRDALLRSPSKRDRYHHYTLHFSLDEKTACIEALEAIGTRQALGALEEFASAFESDAQLGRNVLEAQRAIRTLQESNSSGPVT